MKELKDTLDSFVPYLQNTENKFVQHFYTRLLQCFEKGVGILKTQPAIACSKLKMKTLEQGVKYVQS